MSEYSLGIGTPGGGGFGSANLRTTADRERDQTMGYNQGRAARCRRQVRNVLYRRQSFPIEAIGYGV